MSPEYTEMIAAIAIGVLSAIFISAFLILIVICRRQRLYYKATVCDSQEEVTTRYINLKLMYLIITTFNLHTYIMHFY